MLNFKENIDALDKIILNYLTVTDNEFKLFDENNEAVDRSKLIKLINHNFFNNELIVTIYKAIKIFHAEYGKIPTRVELYKFMTIKNTEITKDQFETVFSVDLSKYTPDFIYQYTKTFILLNSINFTLGDIAVYIKTQDITPNNINQVYDYIRNKININMDIDLSNENMGLDIRNPQSHIQPVKNRKSTGYNYFDRVLDGGWEKKTLVVLQGRPKIGKSLFLCNLAVRAVQMGSNVGIFTVELGDRKYVKRLGSNLYNIPFKEYSKFVDENALHELKPVMDKYYIDHPETGELWTKEYPTGGASVIDIENYFLKMQDYLGKKFDIIIVDYVNLLKPAKDENTMYERVKKICEELRRIAQRNDWCVISATQVKSNYFTADELYLDSTAESSGLVATVDSLFGITGDPAEASVKVKNLANRDAGNMDAYAHFIKDKVYFRLVEDRTPGSDYYTDDEGGDLLKVHYEELGMQNPIAELKLIESPAQVPVIETPTGYISSPAPINAIPEPIAIPEVSSDPNALLRNIAWQTPNTNKPVDFSDILGL